MRKNIKDYSFDYPSEPELLEIFPEAAKEIIPQKIKDWEAEKAQLLKEETLPVFKEINTIPDEVSREFYKKAYMAMPRVVAPMFLSDYTPSKYTPKEIQAHLTRLKRLKALASKPALRRGYESFNVLKERAKEQPIQQLYSFEKLRKVGNRYIAKCPFHSEKTPSFVIYPENRFKCFGSCASSGDAIDFMRKLRGCSFPEAVETLSGGAR